MKLILVLLLSLVMALFASKPRYRRDPEVGQNADSDGTFWAGRGRRSPCGGGSNGSGDYSECLRSNVFLVQSHPETWAPDTWFPKLKESFGKPPLLISRVPSRGLGRKRPLGQLKLSTILKDEKSVEGGGRGAQAGLVHDIIAFFRGQQLIKRQMTSDITGDKEPPFYPTRG